MTEGVRTYHNRKGENMLSTKGYKCVVIEEMKTCTYQMDVNVMLPKGFEYSMCERVLT